MWFLELWTSVSLLQIVFFPGQKIFCSSRQKRRKTFSVFFHFEKSCLSRFTGRENRRNCQNFEELELWNGWANLLLDSNGYTDIKFFMYLLFSRTRWWRVNYNLSTCTVHRGSFYPIYNDTIHIVTDVCG